MAVEVRHRIAGAVAASGMTQKRVAKLSGVTPMTLSRWVCGVTDPNAERIAQLADALGLSRSWIAWGEGKPSADRDRSARILRCVRRAHKEAREQESAAKGSMTG